MRILLLVHAFNSLSQRLHAELRTRGHEVSVEFDINDQTTIQAVQLFQPDIVVAPFLRRAIPEAVWRHNICLVLHPGPVGDRGPAALDWAILRGEERWGVTVLQAVAEMDAGPVWASSEFEMRPARKSSLYRHEVTETGVRALLSALERVAEGGSPLLSENIADGRGWQGAVDKAHRRVDWSTESTVEILRKFHAADGLPGIHEERFGQQWRLFGAWPEGRLSGPAGEFLARRDGALCIGTSDGALWITHARRLADACCKLPAAQAFGEHVTAVPEVPLHWSEQPAGPTWQEIRYREADKVGYLHFEFYNGAMNTEQCRRLRQAFRWALDRPTRVIVLAGGTDFWSNGLHLNCIESADSPADESWNNIQAMDDLAQEIITTESHVTIAALHGNAGAGGVFLSLAADYVLARSGVVLNPHYKGMGNLYGSEYWTYLLPQRVGEERARLIMENRWPMDTAEAEDQGMIDWAVPGQGRSYREAVDGFAQRFTDPHLQQRVLGEKTRRRRADERSKPLEAYRQEELQHMRLNFYGFDPSYHVARYRFVHKVPYAWTPLHLARHRRLDWQPPESPPLPC